MLFFLFFLYSFFLIPARQMMIITPHGVSAVIYLPFVLSIRTRSGAICGMQLRRYYVVSDFSFTRRIQRCLVVGTNI